MSDEVQRSLGRIEGKLDQTLEMMNSHFEDDRTNFKEVHTRLGKVERKTYYAGGIISLVVAYLTAKLSGHG